MTKKHVLTGLIAWLTIAGLITVACGGGDDSGKKKSSPPKKSSPGDGSEEEPADPEDAPKPTPKAGEYTVAAVDNGGTLKGAVIWAGDVPTAELSYEYTAAKDDAEVCAGGGVAEGGKRKNGRLQLGDRDGGKKGVAHVVVWIEASEGAELKAPADAVIDNRNCEFNPLIQLVGPKTKLAIKNSDTTTHNTKGKFTPWGGEVEDTFNENLKGGSAASFEGGFKKAGQLKLQCDQHYWMEGYAIVQNHPYYAMTDAKGNFEIATAIKPGKYTVHFWHAGYKLKRDGDGKMKGYELPVRWKKADVELKAGANDAGEVEYNK